MCVKSSPRVNVELRSQGFVFPYLYVDNPPFGVDDRHDLWAGVCGSCRGLHLLRPSAYPCCSNPDCDGAFTDTVVTALPPAEQDVILSIYLLGGQWAVMQLLSDHRPG